MSFDYWHRNPPKPFNPDYKPYARKVMDETVKSLERDGWYDKYTLEERQASGKFKERYEEIMAEYEKGYNVL